MTRGPTSSRRRMTPAIPNGKVLGQPKPCRTRRELLATQGLKVVNGYTCPSVWQMHYRFRPFSDESSDGGFAYFAESFDPILDVFDNEGVRFGLQVHPYAIVSAIYTAHRPLKAIGHREAFGFNFATSHLRWQRVDPVKFLRDLWDRNYHIRMKDPALRLDGESRILASYPTIGDRDQGRLFRSLGQRGVNFEPISRTLNRTGYRGLFRSSGKIAGWITQRRRSMPADSLRTWASSRPIGRSTPPMRSEACLV